MKYSIENPLEIEVYLYPKNLGRRLSDGEADCLDEGVQKFFFNKVEIEPDNITFINEDKKVLINRNLEYFDHQMDKEIPCGVGVPDEKGHLKVYDAFIESAYISSSGVTTFSAKNNNKFDELIIYLTSIMIPSDNEIISQRNRNTEIRSANIHGRSRVAAAQIIGNSIHNASLITSGRGKVM